MDLAGAFQISRHVHRIAKKEVDVLEECYSF